MSNFKTGNAVGINSEVTEIKRYTGLANFRPLAVNPTKEELKEITGRDISYDVKYDYIENKTQDDVGNEIITKKFPLTFYMQSVDYDFISSFTIYISDKTITSKSGKKVYTNNLGQTSFYATSIEEVVSKSPFFKNEGSRECYIGEEELISFMQAIIRFNPKADGANWAQLMADNSISPQNLFNKDTQGLKSFISYLKENKNTIIMLAGVKMKEDNNGIAFYQRIIDKVGSWFKTSTGTITDYMYNTLEKRVTKKANEGYGFSNVLFTYKFQEFKEENCVNSDKYSSEPESIATEVKTANTMSWEKNN